jgi:hypothetical protein
LGRVESMNRFFSNQARPLPARSGGESQALDK